MNASNGQLGNAAVCNPQKSASETTNTYPCSAQDKVKLLYRADHQVKLLDLQAEAELLLKQLQALKQQRTEHPVSPIS